ncbi:hypothetical protein MP11Mi_10580 [Gordonia sp. MP11Mi]|uniref:Uncharacterized protein n=1 Tax=Gordonia sp. MP11Mi TaxID=3022769 RepID=A0AA97CVJ9_9ACTN
MHTTTQQSIRPDRGTLSGMLGALAAMIMVLALAASLAPSASAETPAERCRRETSAYNSAWDAIGKKPPVPYKCGGNNEPPPTLSPITPEEAPDETVEPSQEAPKEEDSGGPSMNPPTERRELEHPDSGQKPIEDASNPGPVQHEDGTSHCDLPRRESRSDQRCNL